MRCCVGRRPLSCATILALSEVWSASWSITPLGVMSFMVVLKSSMGMLAMAPKKSGETRPECWVIRGLIALITVICGGAEAAYAREGEVQDDEEHGRSWVSGAPCGVHFQVRVELGQKPVG